MKDGEATMPQPVFVNADVSSGESLVAKPALPLLGSRRLSWFISGSRGGEESGGYDDRGDGKDEARTSGGIFGGEEDPSEAAAPRDLPSWRPKVSSPMAAPKAVLGATACPSRV